MLQRLHDLTHNYATVNSADTMTWERQEPAGNVPSTRNNHISVVVARTKIFVHGGHDGGKWLNDLHILDTESNHQASENSPCWVTPNVAGECPPARVGEI